MLSEDKNVIESLFFDQVYSMTQRTALRARLVAIEEFDRQFDTYGSYENDERWW